MKLPAPRRVSSCFERVAATPKIPRRSKRWIALLLVGLLSFTQASIALAGCFMARGEMPQMAAASTPAPCHDSASYERARLPMPASGCAAHCTMDLQAVGQPLDMVQAPPPAPILHAPRIETAGITPAHLVAPFARSVPVRILLHSFLI